MFIIISALKFMTFCRKKNASRNHNENFPGNGINTSTYLLNEEKTSCKAPVNTTGTKSVWSFGGKY